MTRRVPGRSRAHPGATTEALRAYATERLTTRLHLAGRAATCPLDELAELVPPRGHVIDLGCGHGLLALVLALRSPQRTVLGVEIDADKVQVARRAAARAGLQDRVRFDLVEPDDLPLPDSCDAVVVVDVLYLVPPQLRSGLLTAAVHAVGDGTVVVKEMADTPRWKRVVTVAQELVSVRALGLSRGATIGLPKEADLVRPLLASGARVTAVRLDHGRVHPHLALVARVDDDYARPATRSSSSRTS